MGRVHKRSLTCIANWCKDNGYNKSGIYDIKRAEERHTKILLR